jgi:hypothetical protein
VPNARLHRLWKVLLALALLLLGANSAQAYIGPGADLAFVQQALALFLYALTAASAVLCWPVYVVLRRLRRRKPKSEPAPRVEKATISPPPASDSRQITQAPDL